MSNFTTNTSIYLYADDTVLFSTGNDMDTVRQTIQYDLSKIGKWCHKNKLPLNIKKKCMLLGSRVKHTNTRCNKSCIDNVHKDFVQKLDNI